MEHKSIFVYPTLLNFTRLQTLFVKRFGGFPCVDMNKSYSVTDWAMNDGDSGTDSDQNRVKIWALNLQDDNDSVDFDPGNKW